MTDQSDVREPDGDVWMLERAVVLQILSEDHEECWLCAELAQEVSVPLGALEEALTHLERDGVLQRKGETVWATRAARRIDELELIGI